MQSFPRELCGVLAADCGIKIKSCQGSVTSLFQDLAGHIAQDEVGEIKAELESSQKAAYDRMYAEKILARNTKPRLPSPTKKATTSGNTATTSAQPKKSPQNKRAPQKAGRRRQVANSGNKGRNNKPPSFQPKRQDLMRQLADLTKIVKQFKN